jgi:hypothetical protein
VPRTVAPRVAVWAPSPIFAPSPGAAGPLDTPSHEGLATLADGEMLHDDVLLGLLVNGIGAVEALPIAPTLFTGKPPSRLWVPPPLEYPR